MLTDLTLSLCDTIWMQVESRCSVNVMLKKMSMHEVNTCSICIVSRVASHITCQMFIPTIHTVHVKLWRLLGIYTDEVGCLNVFWDWATRLQFVRSFD